MVTGNGAFGQALAIHPKVDKVGFTGEYVYVMFMSVCMGCTVQGFI